MDPDSQAIQQQIEKRLSELPPDVQNAILAVDFNDKIGAIAAAARLHVDQVQELGNNTMFLMLGFMNENEYKDEVTSLVGGDAAMAQKIIDDVNSKILLSIRTSMQNFAAAQNAPAPKPATPAPAPAGSKPSLAQVLPKESIAMPSAPATQAPVSPAPAPAASAPVVPPPAVPAVPTADMHPADIALNQKTVVTPPTSVPVPPPPAPVKPSETKAAPPKPQDYKADPYREPIA